MNMNKQAIESVGGSVTTAVAAAILVSVLAVMPAQAAARAKAPVATAPQSATTNINFHNIPVRSALQLIAEEGHFNLVVPDSVQGTITLHLRDVTWQEALDVVLRLKGLRMRVEGGATTVAASGG
jgi:type IV pilus assembly protein PilQ